MMLGEQWRDTGDGLPLTTFWRAAARPGTSGPGLIHVLMLVLVWCGCSSRSGTGPALIPVEGTVTLDGKPLAGALVTFIPVGDTRGSGGTGYTDQNGRYTLRSADGGAGVPAGPYRVTISKLVMPDGSDYSPQAGVAPMDSPAQERLPVQYSDLQFTTLQATVSKQDQPIDFALSSAAGVPGRR